MTNHCGSCNACCRVFDVPAVEKKAGVWCKHCDIGKGCKIYETRPEVCVEFKCLWLLSQEREDKRDHLPASLRPDKCKVVITPSTNERVMAAITMPGDPGAWRKPEVYALIKKMADDGYGVCAGAPASTRRVLITRKGEQEVRMTEPDETGMQWNIDEEDER